MTRGYELIDKYNDILEPKTIEKLLWFQDKFGYYIGHLPIIRKMLVALEDLFNSNGTKISKASRVLHWATGNSTFYLDYELGSDANSGSAWGAGNAWKTITSGATAARIAPGDIIRIAKSPAPVSLGITGKWTDNVIAAGGFPTALTITGTANNGSGLIRLTMASTATLTTNDVVQVIACGGTVEADGAWLCTVIDATHIDLQNSVYTNAWTSGGTCQQINSKAVVLASPLTKNITDCESLWTAGAGGDVTPSTVAVATDGKEGGKHQKLTFDAAVQTSKLEAYFAIPSTDFSAYQKISLWIKNSAVIANATTLKITLCSDTAGATPVDTFYIPALPSTARWVPLTLTKDGGGNLGATIQSIAVSTDTTAYTNSATLLLDNIIACTTSGLNLQSLISKNSAEQGGAEGWYGIQSISPYGTIVLLDNETNTKSNAGRGYCGTSETVTTYIRETIKTAMGAAGATVQQVMDNGSLASGNIQFQGGYDTGTGNQTGETFFDGLNGNGYGIYLQSKSYSLINHISAYRYQYGIYLTTSCHHITLDLISDANNNSASGVILNQSYSNTINTISHANNNGGAGVSYGTAPSSYVGLISQANNNIGSGVNMDGILNIVDEITEARNNSTYGLLFNLSNDSIVKIVATSNNGSGGVSLNRGWSSIINGSIAETVEVGGMTDFANSRLFSIKHDRGTYDKIFTDGGTIESQATTLTNGSGIEWKFTTLTNTNRQSNYPLKLSIAKIAVTANNLVTVKGWFKKGHATNIGAKLVCKGGQLAGVPSDVVATKANDTNEEELTITFTPTEAGVIEIEAWAYYVAGHSTVIVDALTITQA